MMRSHRCLEIRMKKITLCLLLSYSICLPQSRRAITFDDLIGFGRVSDPQVSPDGSLIAFVITTYNSDENTSNSNIFFVPLAGGTVRQLTTAKKANRDPRWMPDGKTISFISTRDGESQIWSIPVNGGESKKVSHVAAGVDGLMVSPDGKWYAFNSDVYPDCPDADCNQKRMEAADKSPVKAKMFTRLPYRVWNSWKDGKRSHLFVMPSEGGAAKDLTPGDYDTPPIDLGGNWDYGFSPDSKEMVFTRNPDSMVAVSTNNELYTVPTTGGSAKNITENPADDSQPLFSPDGKYIVYRAMRRAGFEADQNQLVLYERTTGRRTNLSEQLDRSVNDVVWSPDSKAIYFNGDDKGNESLYRLTMSTKNIETLADRGYNHSIRITPDGKTIVFLKESINRPAELYRMDSRGGNILQLTAINENRIAPLELKEKEDFWFEGAGGTKIHGMLVRPPDFKNTMRYPVIFLVHGGPQGQWGDNFGYRWNAQMFASRGYVVVMINPRGSTGYGQKFTDEISGDWGGKVYEDLMKGLDYVVGTYDFVDSKRVATAGASYGGYMMNWIAGHSDRFRCIVTHDGVFNPASMYGTTEELWFTEWEYRGTPYRNPSLYQQWSPLNFVSNFKTPTLVIHSQMDFRVDVSEGFQMFSALQRLGVKSKMLYFPDEGHWVLKPGNSKLWYNTVLDWIDENTK